MAVLCYFTGQQSFGGTQPNGCSTKEPRFYRQKISDRLSCDK